MRTGLLSTLCCLAVMLPAVAFGAGPVISAGLGGTVGTESRFDKMKGGDYKIGFEVGSNHFRHEWAFNQTLYSNSRDDLRLTGGSYQLEFLIWKSGFTPYFGLGFDAGIASVQYKYYGNYYGSSTQTGVYIKPYIVGGVRYTFGFGLGIRAEVTAGAFGNFDPNTGADHGAVYCFNGNLALSYTW
jgi:hypothetical protein